MSYWYELEKEFKELQDKVVTLMNENDLQRDVIQSLSTQVSFLEEAFKLYIDHVGKCARHERGTDPEKIERILGKIESYGRRLLKKAQKIKEEV